MKWWPSDCRSGDLIRVQIGSIWHYGVFLSENEVIQFGKPPRGALIPFEDVRVCATSIDEFSNGDPVEVARLSLREKLRRRSRAQTAAEARGRLGEGGYDLLRNNCEHFAMDCVFGHAASAQAQAALSVRAVSNEDRNGNQTNDAKVRERSKP